MGKVMYRMDEEMCEDIQAHLGRAAKHIRHAMELLSDCAEYERHEEQEEEESEETDMEVAPEQEERARVVPNVVHHDRARKQIILRY